MTAISGGEVVLSLASGLVGSTISTVVLFGIYKNKVDNLESTLGKDEHSGLRRTVGDIKDKVIACETLLTKSGPVIQRESPISLTDRGRALLVNSGGQKFIDDNFDELLQAIEEMQPQTAYDVQEDAKTVVAARRDDARLIPIKEFLFQDGSSLDEAVTVMSIYLRDKALERKGMDID